MFGHVIRYLHSLHTLVSAARGVVLNMIFRGRPLSALVIEKYKQLRRQNMNYNSRTARSAGCLYESDVLAAFQQLRPQYDVLSEMDIRRANPSVTTCDLALVAAGKLSCVQIKREKRKNKPNLVKAFIFDCMRLGEARRLPLRKCIYLSVEGPTDNCIDVINYQNKLCGRDVFQFVHDIDDLERTRALLWKLEII